MQPSPPQFSVSSRYFSVPANTIRSGNSRQIRSIRSPSPELSFVPTTTPGYASINRRISSGVKPTTAIGGMW